MESAHRPFHFMVAFWGERYRDYFADLFLPSLLAPNNLPLLRADEGHRFYIATPRAEWRAIEWLPVLSRLRQHAEPHWVEVESAPDLSHIHDPLERYVAVLDHMKATQRRALEAAYDPRAYGSFHFPDTVISDGMVAALLAHARAGREAVLCPALRQVEEDVLAELEERGLWSRRLPPSRTARELNIAPRSAADLTLRHLHPEMEVFEEGSPHQPPLPPFRIWRVPGGRGIVLHTFFVIPVLMDYSVVPADHAACLDHDAIENVYAFTNFKNSRAVHVVRDSDEFVMLSLTPRATDHAVRMPPGKQPATLRRGYARLADIRRSYEFYVFRNGDTVRHELFRIPVCWHAHDIDQVWLKEERRLIRLFNWALGDYYSQTTNSREWKEPAFNWRTLLFDFPPRLRISVFRTLLQIRELGRGLFGMSRASAS
jgi:hypothetical protein